MDKTDFFGPGVLFSAFGERFFRPIVQNKTINLVGNIDQPHSFLYVKDFARGLITLADEESAYGQIWHIPNTATLSTREFLQEIFKQNEKSTSFRVAPRWLLSLLGLFDSDIREFKEMLYQFENPFVVDTENFEKTFGANPTPLSDAIRETLEWFRLN